MDIVCGASSSRYPQYKSTCFTTAKNAALHAFTRLLLHASSYTPPLTRLLLHVSSYTPTLHTHQTELKSATGSTGKTVGNDRNAPCGKAPQESGGAGGGGARCGGGGEQGSVRLWNAQYSLSPLLTGARVDGCTHTHTHTCVTH
jgi:hypothetical protein